MNAYEIRAWAGSHEQVGSRWRGARAGRWRGRGPACLILALALAAPVVAAAQPSAAQPETAVGESDAVSVSATVLPPKPIFEIGVEVQNKTADVVRVDPARFLLESDQGDQLTPLTAAEAKDLAHNPAQSFWSFFWFGGIGYAANVSQQAEQMRQIDIKILTAADINPGASVKGSIYFRPLNAKATQIALSVDGLTQGTEKLTAVRVILALPQAKTVEGAAPARPVIKRYMLASKGSAGPIGVEVTGAEFAKDSTTLTVTFVNSGAVDVNVLGPVMGATLLDNSGKTYGLRFLKTEIGDKVGANGSLQGRLAFEPVPLPPLTTSVTLILPRIWAGDEVYEAKVEVRLVQSSAP